MKLYRIMNLFPKLPKIKPISLFVCKAFKKTFNYLILFSDSKGMDSLSNNQENNQEIVAKDESSGISKNQKKKTEKKFSKKHAKSINVILFNENKKYEEIISNVPTNNIFIYHYGNGDEDDQIGLVNYFKQKCRIHIFPGISYGFIEFETIPNYELKDNIASIDINFPQGVRNVLLLYSKVSINEVKLHSNSNFPVAKLTHSIPGLIIINDFISEEEEKQLIENIDKEEWKKLTNRRVQHYGYEFVYGANNIDKTKKIGALPDFNIGLNKKFEILTKNFYLKRDINSDGNSENPTNFYYKEEIINTEAFNLDKSFYELFGNFDQLTINNYKPGDGIPPHIDTHSPFEDMFCSLSLNSGAVMTFILKNEQQHVYLKPRSLAIFTREARFCWEHMIAQRKLDKVEDNIIFRKRRISLTFRKIKPGECNCSFKEFCDSFKKNNAQVLTLDNFNVKVKNENDELIPTEIEKKHVYDVYDKIAPHFSHTRYKPWPKVANYLNKLEKGSLNADVGKVINKLGCGNGKYLGVNLENLVNIGTDRSANLLEICRSRGFDVFVADSLKLPFRSNVFDSVISIAVIHHFSTVELRIKAIREILRILRVGGTCLIYVWAMEQEEKKFTEQDNFVPWHLQNTYENDVSIQSLGPEILKDETKNATVYHRYYHVFIKGEIENLINQIPELELLESYYDHANWCVVCKKLK